MEFTVQKANLESAMDVAIRAIPKHTTMPILYTFLFEVEGTKGVITATDMGTSIRTEFTCMATEGGKMCVDAKTLVSAVKKMGKSDITFKTEDNAVIVTGAKARYEMPIRADVDEYPELQEIKDSTKFTIDGDVFSKMIDGVAFSASTKENNKLLTGINLWTKNGKLRLTALDLVRVAIRSTEVDCKEDINTVVPLKAMTELAKSIYDMDVDIEYTRFHIRFTFGNTTMIARLIDGNYFNVDQILKNEPDIHVKVDKKELMETIDRALVVQTDNVPIVFDIKDNIISTSYLTNISKFDEDVECEKTGDDIRIGLNPKYVLDALKAADDDEIVLNMHNSNSPMFIADDEGTYIYIVLPVNIN